MMFSFHSYFGLAQQLLQLVLGQQTVVLHKGRDLGRSLGLIIHCAVNLHVPVQNLQEIFLALLGGEKGKDWSARLRAKGEDRRNRKSRLCWRTAHRTRLK